MGVMACCRTECENIMCDRYSTTHGHLCNECFDELVQHGPMTKLVDFLDHSPRRHLEDASRAFFDQIFPMSHSHDQD